jgi:hypothetical protein
MLLAHRIKTREGVLYAESPLRQIMQVAYVIKNSIENCRRPILSQGPFNYYKL